jgi:hypothetical protein
MAGIADTDAGCPLSELARLLAVSRRADDQDPKERLARCAFGIGHGVAKPDRGKLPHGKRAYSSPALAKLASGRVWYLIEAVSRPRNPLARLGWPLPAPCSSGLPATRMCICATWLPTRNPDSTIHQPNTQHAVIRAERNRGPSSGSLLLG